MKKSKRVLLTFLITNLLIVFLPLTVFSMAYYNLTEQVVQDIEKTTEQQVRQGQRLVDAQLSSAYRISTTLSTQKDILLNAMKTSFTPIERYNLRMLNTLLSSYGNVHESIQSVYIDLPKSNLIIGNDAIYNSNDFFGSFFTYGNYTREDWLAQTRDTYSTGRFLPLADITSKGEKLKGAAYVKSIGGASADLGSIIIIYDCDVVMQAMKTSVETDSFWWGCVLDQDGNTIFAPRQPMEKELYEVLLEIPPAGVRYQNDFIVVSGASAQGNLCYVSAFRYNDVFAQSNQVLTRSILFCVIAAVFGLCISLLVANFNSKPVVRVMGALEGATPDKNTDRTDPYRNIEHGVQKLRAQIDAQNHSLQAFYIQKLLYGKFSTQAEAEEEADAVHFVWAPVSYQIAILRVCTDNGTSGTHDRQGAAMLSAEISALLESLDTWHFVYQESHRDYLLLLKAEEDTRAVLQKLIEQVNTLLEKHAQIHGMIGVGEAFDQLTAAADSHEQARTVVSNSGGLSGKLLFHSELPSHSLTYYYPAKIESELIRCVKTGDQVKTQAIIQEIFSENTTNRCLSFSMMKQLMAELCGTAIRLSTQLPALESSVLENFRKQYDAFTEVSELKKTCEVAEQCFVGLSECYWTQMKSHNSALIKRIVDYIDENCTDSNLSLSTISTTFEMNENYVSTFFKEQTGSNFSAYVEELRIQKATGLLGEQGLSIEQIAEQVGYSNHHSFRRAFKKVTHQTPSDYRKNETRRG